MAAKSRSSAEELHLVRNTLSVRDPNHQTVAVGSVAVVAQLAEVGLESPIGIDDVDVLCSADYFDNLLQTGPFMEDIRKFQVRWPHGRLKERGATNKSIDIYPDTASSDILPFTACYSMSDLWYPIDYDSSQPDVVKVSGIRLLRIGKMLEWMAIVGREKDTEAVDKILPIAQEAGLVDHASVLQIETQLQRTQKDRVLHPNRYYARIDL